MSKKIAGGIMALIIFGLVFFSGCTSSDDTQDSPEKEKEQTIWNLGDRVVVGEFAYTINSYERMEAIKLYSSGWNYDTLKPEGVFMVVNLTVENLGDESTYFSSSYVQLMDSQKRSFDQGTNIWQVDGLISAEQLQPGMPKNGVMVFDVLEGESYTIRLNENIYWGDEYTEVTLE